MSEKQHTESISIENKQLYDRKKYLEAMRAFSANQSYDGPEKAADVRSYTQQIETAHAAAQAFYKAHHDTLHDLALEEDTVSGEVNEPGEKDEYNYELAPKSSNIDHGVDIDPMTLSSDEEDDGWSVFWEDDEKEDIEPMDLSSNEVDDEEDDDWYAFLKGHKNKPSLEEADKEKGELPHFEHEPDESEYSGEAGAF